jgi:hypothetical protein
VLQIRIHIVLGSKSDEKSQFRIYIHVMQVRNAAAELWRFIGTGVKETQLGAVEVCRRVLHICINVWRIRIRRKPRSGSI